MGQSRTILAVVIGIEKLQLRRDLNKNVADGEHQERLESNQRCTTTNAMSLITKKTRIDAKRVAEIIGCSRKTVLNGGAGTAKLTRIRNGTRQVRFILEEVIAFAEKQEHHAQRRLPNPSNEQETHGQRQALSL